MATLVSWAGILGWAAVGGRDSREFGGDSGLWLALRKQRGRNFSVPGAPLSVWWVLDLIYTAKPVLGRLAGLVFNRGNSAYCLQGQRPP